jgi:hypothetical protein
MAERNDETMVRTLILGVLFIAMVASVAGAWTVAYARGKDDGRSEALAARDSFIQERPGGAGGNMKVVGPGDKTGGAPKAVQGITRTVERVDGQTITVKTESGSVPVTLQEQTQVNRQVSATADSLKAGDTVQVLGQKRDGDAIAADVITIME